MNENKIEQSIPNFDISKELNDLDKLNDYAYQVLISTEGKQLDMSSREVYLHGLYVSAIAQVQGILTLAGDKQYRVGRNLVRTLFEVWVDTHYIYCSRSYLYVRLLVLTDEKNRLSHLELLKSQGHIAQSEINKHKKRLKSIEKFILRKYPQWPDHIPGVVNPSNSTPVQRKGINLKQRCQVIDFYNQKYNRVRKGASTMASIYEMIYPYLSGGAHPDPRSLGAAFSVNNEVIEVDVYGSNWNNEAARMCYTVFAWQYELIETVKKAILKEKPPRFPENIELLAKNKGIIE